MIGGKVFDASALSHFALLGLSRLAPSRERHTENATVESQHIVISRDGNQLHPHVIRYACPDEIDRMARAARLRLEDRWANWSRKSFGTGSFKHVSVYRLAD